MRRLWTHREIDAPAEVVWDRLTDLDAWADWGPSVRSARLDGDRFEQGATGTVTSALGPSLRFEITAYEEGARWAWKVAGIGATDHTVEPLGVGRCRAGFGVPWVAAPYLAVCQLALQRLDVLAKRELTP